MDTLIDIIKRGLNEEDGDIMPKLVVGIACFGAALVFNALMPVDKYPEESRRDRESRRAA